MNDIERKRLEKTMNDVTKVTTDLLDIIRSLQAQLDPDVICPSCEGSCTEIRSRSEVFHSLLRRCKTCGYWWVTPIKPQRTGDDRKPSRNLTNLEGE